MKILHYNMLNLNKNLSKIMKFKFNQINLMLNKL